MQVRVIMYCGSCGCMRDCVRSSITDVLGYTIGEQWCCLTCGSGDNGTGVIETESEDAEARELIGPPHYKTREEAARGSTSPEGKS
jgi:hypothetical protein